MKTNLLKSIFISLILVMGVSNAWAKTIYFKPSDNWKQASAWFQVWDGSNDISFTETGVSGLYKADIKDSATTVYIKRKGPNGENWDGGSKTTLNSNNYFYNSDWSNSMTGSKIIGTITGGHIYFDNSTTSWTGNIQFVIGHSNYSRTYEMTQIENTQLWYVNLTNKENHTWGDATYYGFIASSNKFGDGNWGSGNLSKASKYTAAYTSTYSLNDGGTYYCTPSSASNGKSFTIEYKNAYNAISELNATQSAKVRTTTSGSYSTVASGNWPATLELQGTYLSGNGASDRSEISSTKSTDGDDKKVYGAVVTGLITHSYSNLSDDYQFDGWIKGSGTSLTSTNSTYSYNITAATTVYACFTKKYAVTFGASGSGAISAKVGNTNITSGNKIVGGSNIIFTATPSAGYQIEGWYSNAGCTTSLNNGTSTTYTVNNLTGATTVYVKFEKIPETKYPINITTEGNGTVSLNASEQIGASGKSITATPSTGYQFTGWECTGGASVENSTSATTIITATAEGTVTAKFEPKTFTITYKDKGNTTFSGTHATGYPTSHTYGQATTLQNATKDGYLFVGWFTTSACTGTAVTTLGANNYTNNITLYAKWVPYSQCVFFKNNLGWGEVYVYTFSENAWYDTEDPNTKYGPGVCPQVNKVEIGKKMTRIGDSDVYYYVMTQISTNHTQDNNANKNYIAFANKDMSTYDEFYGAEAVWRGDHKNNLTFFIPQLKEYQISQGTVKEVNQTKYYNKGLWMKYNSTESGYQIATNNNAYDDPPGLGTDDGKGWETHGNKLTTQTPGGYTFSITKTLNANTTYEFKIHNYMWVIDHEGRENNQWFGDDGTLTNDNCTKWGLIYEENQETKRGNTKIKTTIAGDYTFNIYLGDGRVILSVDYPLSVGDYQLRYTDDTYDNDQYHKEERIIKKCSTGSRKDTISFFVRRDKHPKVQLYRCSNANSKTWDPVATLSNITVDSTSVYNFVIEQTNEDTHQASFTGDYFLHTGDFYIRTDAADGGWKNYSQDSHRFTYSSYADEHEDFSHYFCKWVTVNNVKFNVATDYSETLCSSMAADPTDANPRIVTNSDGNLPNNNGVNVRFGWDCHTNQLTRAYLAGADTDYFLRIIDAEHLKKQDGTNVTNIQFKDLQNWIYQLDVKATASTKIKLVADYANERQFFKGSETQTVGLLGSTATREYDIRLIYNFKTNHLVAAMILGGDYEVTTDGTLGADMMVIRKDQGDAEQLTFNPNSKQLAEVGTVYAVMTFTEYHITDNTKTERERSLYWVSFPFDVKVSDVFGFGEYGEEWILQYYDGAERAEKGLFGDSGTYWKYIEDTKTTLNAGTGYVLALDLSKVKFLHGATEVSLYFPSTEPVKTISGELPTAATIPEHWCNIDREWTENGTTYHHKWTDSHWNLIGVPGFADITGFDVTQYSFMQKDASFYYNFSLANSRYNVESSNSTRFNAMYAYMVQFAGKINWSLQTVAGVAGQPKELAARRSNDIEPENVILRLELTQGEEKADQTFVQLQQEGATAEFDMNLDLTKIINSGANIYTLAGEQRIQSAGNALPMDEVIVPVGVKIDAEGEYTFRMPDGTEGMVVELIDYERDITTNLLLFDYTVTLPAGSNESRFALHVQPNKSGVTTGVENVGDKAKGIEKYLINGKLIIRTAEGVFDAQGKRL